MCFVCDGLYRVAYVCLTVCVSVCLFKNESVVCLMYCMVMYSVCFVGLWLCVVCLSVFVCVCLWFIV